MNAQKGRAQWAKVWTPLHLGDYLPLQQMAVARKNTSVTYIWIGMYGKYTDPWYFRVRSDLSEIQRCVQEFTGPYTALFMQRSLLQPDFVLVQYVKQFFSIQIIPNVKTSTCICILFSTKKLLFHVEIYYFNKLKRISHWPKYVKIFFYDLFLYLFLIVKLFSITFLNILYIYIFILFLIITQLFIIFIYFLMFKLFNTKIYNFFITLAFFLDILCCSRNMAHI